MIFKYNSKNVEITNAMKDYLQDKISKLEKNFLSSEQNINVTFIVENYLHKVKITTYLDKTHFIRVENETEDMYESIDKVVDKFQRKLRKLKEKQEVKKFKNISYIEPIIKDKKENNIIREKKIDAYPMSDEEAQLQIEVSDYNFYIYEDIETSNLKLIYKRRKKGYGIIYL